MPELKDVITQLVELKPGEAEFARALKEGAQPLYQRVFDDGHSMATRENKDKIRELTEERDTEKQRAEDLQGKLTEAEKKQPDIAAVRKQYDEELKKKDDEFRELKKSSKAAVKEAKLEARKESLIATLAGMGVDKDYAEIQIGKHFGRVDIDSEGRVVVMQDGKQIPLQADDPLKALADEIKAATPPKFLTSNADTGSGTQNEGGAGTGKALYDGIRSSVQKTEKENKPGKSAAERLGGVTAGAV